QLVLVERRCVGDQPALVFQTALDKIKGDLWQAPLRHLVQVFDIDGVFDLHRLCSPQRIILICSMAHFGAPRQSLRPNRVLLETLACCLQRFATQKQREQGSCVFSARLIATPLVLCCAASITWRVRSTAFCWSLRSRWECSRCFA